MTSKAKTTPAVSAGTAAAAVALMAILIQDEGGNVLRTLKVPEFTPAKPYNIDPIGNEQTEITFCADDEGNPDQIRWIDVTGAKQRTRAAKLAEYPAIVPGSLFYSDKACKYGVVVRCRRSGGLHRRWTSDLHQCEVTDRVKVVERRERTKAKRADAKKSEATTVAAPKAEAEKPSS